MVADEARRQCAVVEPGQLGQGRLTVEEPGVVSSDQLDARRADVQLVALSRQRSVEAAPRLAVRHQFPVQLEGPGHRQKVHASSLR